MNRFAALAAQVVGRRVRLREPAYGDTIGTVIRVTAAGLRIRLAVSQRTVTRHDSEVTYL